MTDLEKPYWHTTRPHDDECATLRVAAAKEMKPMPPCIPGCRVGQHWPTLRLLPEQLRHLEIYDNHPGGLWVAHAST